MLVTRIILALVAVALSAQVSWAQSSVQACPLETLQLESGESIPNFRMTYITFGRLNTARSNAVLQIHGLRGTRDSQTTWAGPGKAFDTDKYFVIQPDTLGVASVDPSATTSPTRSGLNMRFPRFRIRDMVHAEYRMLTECLGLSHLVAVSGSSMGGIESMQWAVSYPDFMDAVIPIVPQAFTAKQSIFIWETARRVIMLDPKWMGGEYPANNPPRAGVGAGLIVQTAFGSSSIAFKRNFQTRDAVLASYQSQSASAAASVEARDWIYRTYAIDSHNIAETSGFGGDLAAAARAIKARLLLFPNCYDQLHPPRASGVFDVAEHAPVAKVVNLNDIGGHGGPAPQAALITAEIKSLLSRIEAGIPGIDGPRFPKGASRPESCSPGGFVQGDETEAK
jgi:homoserine O-acetyltransferase